MKITFSMDNRTVFYKLGMVMALAVAFQGCKPKINEIDNNQVISKPYSLYYGDASGTIYNTNDGYNPRIVVSADGSPVKGLIASGNNLIFEKQRGTYVIEYSVGATSNPTQAIANPNAHGPSMFLDWPKYKRVYYAGYPTSTTPNLIYSKDTGSASYGWFPDGVASSPVTSMTMLANGRVITYSDGDKSTTRCDDPVNTLWAGSGNGGLPITRSFFISHIVNTVLAIADTSDVYYSTNDGGSWTKYNKGLPANSRSLCACAPGDQVVLVGTDGQGIFRLPIGSLDFQPSSTGLHQNARVRSIVGKYDYYKNEKKVSYVFAATDKGLYRSSDNGETWVKLNETDCVSMY